MAQFEIHRAAEGDGEIAPFLIDIQSNEFREKGTRIVIPLLRGTGYPSSVPVVIVEGTHLIADVLLMSSVPRSALGDVERALTSDEVIAVMNAFDRIISSAYS